MFNSIQIIGDPHLNSQKIGYRKKTYPIEVLTKLEFCAAQSHETDSYSICLGDLFHRFGENNIAYLSKIVKVLKKFKYPLIVLEGNHDREHFALQEGDTLELLQAADLILIRGDGFQEKIRVKDKLVQITYLSNGMEIPDAVEKAHDADYSIMVTHHDLAIGSAYPGALPLKEIQGVDLVINGHMHNTFPKKQVGKTAYQNPGNIEPISRDLRNFVPKVWYWPNAEHSIDLTELKGVALPHDKDCFILTGLNAPATTANIESLAQEGETPISEALAIVQDTEGSPVNTIEPSVQSFFAENLSKELVAPKTTDATILQEDVKDVLDTGEYKEDTKKLFELMLQKLKKIKNA